MRGAVVAVLGAAGFIGRHLVARLAEQGAVIRALSRDPDRALHLKPLGDVGQIVLLGCDPSDDRALGAALAGADHAVNLIGILHERRAGDFDRIHGELPGRLGRIARAQGLKRVVHVSAIGADPASPSAYARSKAKGEAALRAERPDAVILRPSIVFGPEDQFFNRFAAMASLSPALPLIGGGHTRFQPVHVGDVAQAIVAALTRADTPGRTYELGGPRVATFRELLAYMLTVTRRRRLLLNLPFGLARLQGRLLQLLPNPPLTEDQVRLLERDNVVGKDMPGLADLGIAATPMEAVVPGYLDRFIPETRRVRSER
jgi:NADH dehydrogenase